MEVSFPGDEPYSATLDIVPYIIPFTFSFDDADQCFVAVFQDQVPVSTSVYYIIMNSIGVPLLAFFATLLRLCALIFSF